MLKIVGITSEFYAPAITLGRKSTNPNVIGSKWSVDLSAGSFKTRRIYHITLSETSPDPHYDSINNILEKNQYFIQIDDKPTVPPIENANEKKDYGIYPKDKKRKPIYYYHISPNHFEPIVITKVFERLRVPNAMIEKTGKLGLSTRQAKIIFQAFFEEQLLSYIKIKTPFIEDGRSLNKKETIPLLAPKDSETLCCDPSNIWECIKTTFCCS